MKRIAMTGLLMAAMALASNGICSAAPLRIQFKAGTSTKYDMKMTLDSGIMQKGNLPLQLVKPMRIDSTGTVLVEVSELDDKGIATLKMSALEIHSMQDGAPMAANPAPTMGMPAIDMSEMLKKGITFTVDDRFRVVKLPDTEAPAMPFDMEALMKQMLDSAMGLPDGDVEPGDSWNKDVTLELPIFSKSITVSIFGSLDDIKDGAAQISTEVSINETDLKLNLEGMNLPVGTGSNLTAVLNKMDLKVNLSRTLDLENGIMKEMTMNLEGDIDFAGGMGGGGSEMKIQLAGPIKAEFQITEAADAE